MTAVTFGPVTINSASLTLGGTDYTDAVLSAVFTPTVKQNTITAINSKSVTSQTPSTWTLDLTLAQDFETVGSLVVRLHNDEGTTETAVFTEVDGGSTFTAQVTLAPGQIGDDAGNIAQSKVSLGSTKPVIAAAS